MRAYCSAMSEWEGPSGYGERGRRGPRAGWVEGSDGLWYPASNRLGGHDDDPPGWGCLIACLVVLVVFSILFLNGTITGMFADEEDDPSPATTTEEPLR